LVIKALDSPWKIKDRSNNWLKLKPDYGAGFEIECLIVGAYFGTGRQGARISEFLMALAVTPDYPQQEPTVFETFCK